MSARGNSMETRQWLNAFEKIVAQACFTTSKDRRTMYTEYNVILPPNFLEFPTEKKTEYCRVINYAIPALLEMTNINSKLDRAKILEPIMYFALLLAEAVEEEEELRGIYNQFKTAIYRATYALGLREIKVNSGDLMKEFGYADPPSFPDPDEKK